MAINLPEDGIKEHKGKVSDGGGGMKMIKMFCIKCMKIQ